MVHLTFQSDEIRNRLWPEYKLAPYNSTSSNLKATISLVHNQGLYLVARFGIENSRPEASVVYAKGCNPTKDPDWQAHSRSLVGGDDFSQELPPEWFEKVLFNDDEVTCLGFTDSHIELIVTEKWNGK